MKSYRNQFYFILYTFDSVSFYSALLFNFNLVMLNYIISLEFFYCCRIIILIWLKPSTRSFFFYDSLLQIFIYRRNLFVQSTNKFTYNKFDFFKDSIYWFPDDLLFRPQYFQFSVFPTPETRLSPDPNILQDRFFPVSQEQILHFTFFPQIRSMISGIRYDTMEVKYGVRSKVKYAAGQDSM